MGEIIENLYGTIEHLKLLRHTTNDEEGGLSPSERDIQESQSLSYLKDIATGLSISYHFDFNGHTKVPIFDVDLKISDAMPEGDMLSWPLMEADYIGADVIKDLNISFSGIPLYMQTSSSLAKKSGSLYYTFSRNGFLNVMGVIENKDEAEEKIPRRLREDIAAKLANPSLGEIPDEVMFLPIMIVMKVTSIKELMNAIEESGANQDFGVSDEL